MKTTFSYFPRIFENSELASRENKFEAKYQLNSLKKYYEIYTNASNWTRRRPFIYIYE